MAKTIKQGYYIAGGASSETLHSNAGRILGVLVSALSNTTVTFYDAAAATPGTEILVLSVTTDTPPLLMFDRNNAIPFSTALHIDPGAADVNVWSIDYG